MRVYGTAMALHDRACLLIGESGSGKSDLALRLIDRGWRLIGDDQCHVTRRSNGALEVAGEPRLEGRLEVRGLGLVPIQQTQSSALLVLEVKLAPSYERLPVMHFSDYHGEKVPQVTLNAFETSAPIKLEYAVSNTLREGWVVL